MRKSPAREPIRCGFLTCLPQTKKGHRLCTLRRRRVGQSWFVTFWLRARIHSSSMRTAKSQSICSLPSAMAPPAAMAGQGDGAEPAPQAPPREPPELEVVAVRAVEAVEAVEPSVLLLQPRS